MVNRAVFLDRDGVINQPFVRDGLPFPPASAADFKLMPGVREACESLKDAGFLLVVVTNQPDVGRGTQSETAVRQMNETMCGALPIDRVEVCFDADDFANSGRRKPQSGMLLDAASALGIDLGKSFMVGDRWRDIDCGNAAGCTTILIDRNYDEPLRTQPAMRSPSLLAAARQIVKAPVLEDLTVKIYADGADRERMFALYADPLISGLTTNPTLMYKAGIRDYEAFAKDVLRVVRDKPVSFEVLSDDFNDMCRQALKIAGWGDNVYVKIPVTNTLGETSRELIRYLSARGIKVNVTAILTASQVRSTAEVLSRSTPAVVSVFAGRIADCGIDPLPVMRSAKLALAELPQTELLWASVREVWNLYEAHAAGCDIVTVPHEILKKAMKSAGSDLTALSLETVRMFAGDAAAAGFWL